jgi:hypothetical protein
MCILETYKINLIVLYELKLRGDTSLVNYFLSELC